MAILTGAVILSGRATISDTVTTLNNAGISAHSIGETSIASEESSSVVSTGVSASMGISGKSAPSANATLSSNGAVVIYVVGATDIQAAATMSVLHRMTLRGRTKGHAGMLGVSTLATDGKMTGLLKASLVGSANLFTSIRAVQDAQTTATLTVNATVIKYHLGSIDILTTGTLQGYARVTKPGMVAMSSKLSLVTNSFVLTGLNNNNIKLFIQGGETGTMNLFMKSPDWASFASSITEGDEPDLGDVSNKPSPTLFINGKGTSFNHNTTLFMPAASIAGNPNYSMNLFINGGTGVSPANSSINLFLANKWSFIETSARAPGFRNSEVPLFLKMSNASLTGSMNLFMGKGKNPSEQMTLFMNAPTAAASGLPPLYISGLVGPNNNMNLFMRGPLDSIDNSIDLSINGY